MADPENQGTNTAAQSDQAPPEKSGGGGSGGDIGLSMAYIMSISGILKIVEFFTLMIAFALGADIDYVGTWGRMSFFLFVTITSWILVIAVFVLFAFNIISKINLNIDWNIPVLVFAVVVAFLLLISSSLIADDAGSWKSSVHDKLRAAAMEGDSPAQLPIAQTTQAQAPPGQPVISQQQVPPGQPIMYQMQPGQQQPVFVQVPAGQPATTPDGQPIQYYYVPVTQPMQPGQQGQPVQPVQPVQPGQPVYVQGAPGQQVQPQQQAGQGLDFTIDTDFLKSPLCYIKIAEFVVLLGAWASILKYFDDLEDLLKSEVDDDKANFFKGITVFCWVMVILYLIIHTLSLPKICNCQRPSMFTLTSLIFYFIMFALLLACTGNLVSRAVWYGDLLKQNPSNKTIRKYVTTLSVALAFGFLSCIAFVVDMVLNYKLFQTQRAQEMPPDQGPPQRRAWDVNTEYLRSPVFYVKLAEIALLFAAWVCIIKYFDMAIFKSQNQTPAEDSKADFFRGITIFSWVMVVLLALMFVLSFDKLCSRSSPWTLTALFIHFILSVLLIACCGNMTKHAIDWGKAYKNVYKSYKPNVLALLIGLAFGYISWIIFIVDIQLLYKLYKQQRAEEVGHPQQAGQPGVVQQPAVVIVPQGAKQQVYQPVTHPGQQPVQYPGQQPVLMGMPPPVYSQQPPQGENQK